jgi:Ca2+-transporting ATPase
MTQNDLNTLEGLSTAQAATRLAEDGPNDITPVHRRSVASRLLDMLRQPMFALLLAAAVLYMTLGDLTEGLTLSVFVLAVLGLTFYQEGKSEASIQALRDLTQASAHVMRSGQKTQVPAREVVTGDLLVLSEGDRVAADGQLQSANNLQIDESLLTGESVPVSKSTSAEDHTVHAGSFVVRGQGLARVTATGQRSQIGRIGQSLNELTSGTTPLQAQTAQLVQRLAVIVLLMCIGMVLTLGLRSGQWIPALLSGIALAMAILPEEYPVVLTIFPALGAHRLTREGVLTRRINAIETLGATTVLCTDKTGTLTQNRMTVTAMAVGPAHPPVMASLTSPAFALPEAFHPLLEHAILASAPEPFDPMETAFHATGQIHLAQTPHLHDDNWRLVQRYALSPELKAMSHVWQFDESLDRVVSAKGAPEAVMDLCQLSQAERQVWSRTIDSMAAQGLRVLAVAQSHFEGNDWPETPHAFAFEWLGLIGLTDPLRPEIPQAMAECQSAGIRVIMITGDYPTTAQVIATQAGLPPGQTLTGDALDRLSDEALQALLPQVSVCARISPHQKLRIVQALQAHGEVVTMTGDGVNDAPALQAAHVGVAMGLRGTDVAREAADLVLVDDNFASIVRGIRVGRRIFGNLQKSMRYIFAIHIPIAGIALAPMVMAWPALMLPLHVALLEMVIDPACSIAFENEPADADVMQRPPRDTRAALFGMKDIAWALAQGLLVLACVGLTYAWAKGWIIGETPRAWLEEEIRAMVFVTLVLGYAALIVVNRAAPGQFLASLHVPNPSAWGVILLAWACVVLGMYWPWLAEALKFAPLQAPQWAVALSAGGLSLVALVDLQWVWSQYPARRS